MLVRIRNASWVSATSTNPLHPSLSLQPRLLDWLSELMHTAWSIDKEHTMKRNLPALLDAGRRGFLIAGLALAASLALPAPGALAQDWSTEHWVGTWGAGPGGPPLPATTQTFTDQTVR